MYMNTKFKQFKETFDYTGQQNMTYVFMEQKTLYLTEYHLFFSQLHVILFFL